LWLCSAFSQVAFEGRIAPATLGAHLARGRSAAGDLIPWTLAQQFGDDNFAQLCGAR
jgi:N-acetyltransferase 10